jgi:multiple sugar transport system permease protein
MVDILGTAPTLPVPALRSAQRRFWRGTLLGSEYVWAVAFCVPYVAVFLAFVAYPIAFGVWMGSDPSLYPILFTDPIYAMTVFNTALYVGIAVNLKMVCALFLSAFFMRPGWWTKALLMLFVLPWAVPAVPAFMSIHWLLNGEYGLMNNLLYELFGITGPEWLASRWTAFGAVLFASMWKALPFWTVILLAGRMAIPSEILDAAKVDGATGLRHFLHVTFPLLANLYLVSTLLSTIFMLGDYNPIFFVTGAGPAHQTSVLATLSIRYAFDMAQPRLGVAAALTALPVLVPLVVILMRKFRTSRVEL